MPDIFISFSMQDKPFADFLHNHLVTEGVDVFQASLSLKPGQQWSQEILQNLRDSKCVLFLASKAACQSSYVNQEVGASVISGKNLIPVVWDMPPENLPGWANQYQVINLDGVSVNEIRQIFSQIASKLKFEKLLKVGGLLVAGYFLFCCLRK